MKTKTEIKTTSEIKNSYLMWVGAEHYEKIGDYTDEAVVQGISKRMPNVETAQKLMEPGTVVFLAHDEHDYRECPDCLAKIECPDCRKRDAEMARLDEQMETLTETSPSKVTPEDVARVEKSMAKTREKIAALEAENDVCRTCAGAGTLKAGSGGTVEVDGEPWDYRKYNYWLHQPKSWLPTDHKISATMCERCGGTGRLPNGKVFGLFLPSQIEWIVPAGADEALKAEMAKRGFKLVDAATVEAEPKRGCGKRHPGGVYVVTKPTDEGERAEALLAEMVENGMVKAEGAEVKGNFIRFVNPVEIDAKRFRGLKRWSLSPKAEAEAEMILEAVAS